MPKFPGVLLNNNPNAPSLDLNDLQVKGVGIFANVAERDALDANIQTEGYLSVMKNDDNVYIYKGGGWTTPANWEKISGTIGFTDSDGNPLGEVSTLVFPEGSISIVGTSGVVEFSAGGTSTDTTNFNGVLSSADTTVQAALDTLDGLSLTLEGLGDTPSGYGTAGQVLITNGVDGFTFGSGSPWEEVAGTTTNIKYESGVVGITNSVGITEYDTSTHTNINIIRAELGNTFPGGNEETLLHLHNGNLAISKSPVTSTYPNAFITLKNGYHSTSGGYIGLQAYNMTIGGPGQFEIKQYDNNGNIIGNRLSVGSSSAPYPGGYHPKFDSSGLWFPGGILGNPDMKITMGGSDSGLQFYTHTNSVFTFMGLGVESTNYSAGIYLGAVRSGKVAYIRSSDPNTAGSYGYVGVNVNNPTPTGPAFEVSSSYAKFNDGLHIGDITATGYAFPTATGTTGQVLKVDANGDLVFGDDLSGLWTSDTNGITYAGHVGVDIASDINYPLTVGGGVKVGGKLSLYSDAAQTVGNVLIAHGNMAVNPSVGAHSILIGGLITSTSSNSIIIGYNVTGSGQDLVIGSSTYHSRAVIGSNPGGIGTGSVGIYKAAAAGYAVAIGQASNANVSGGVAIGLQTMSGDGVAIGNRAGTGNTSTNVGNVNIGVNAGHRYYNPGGQDFNNTVNIGYEAGRSMAYNTSITGNSVNIGYQTGYFAEGGNNVMIGYRAGYGVDGTSTGSGNVFLGNSAGYSETGSNKLYISNSNTTTPLIYGEFDNNILRVNGTLQVESGITLEAGQLLFSSVSDGIRLQSAFNTTAGVGIGYQAIASGGPGSVAIGNQVRSPNSGTVVIGYSSQAMNYTATDPRAVHIGQNAGTTVTTGADTVAIGNSPLSSLTTGSGNLAIGRTAGSAITTQSYNTFIGYEAGRTNTGSNNTFVGKEAGELSTTGSNNVGIGSGALSYVEGDNNTALGTNAGNLLTTGINNVLLGQGSGSGVTTGGSNVAVGYAAGMAHDSSSTVVIGYNAGGDASSTGDEQVIIGNNAGTGTISGASVIIGSSSANRTIGYGNVVIGRQAANMATGGSTGQNNILIGKRVMYNRSYALGSGNIIIGENGSLYAASNNNIYIKGNGDALYINIGGSVTTNTPGITLGGTSEGDHSISMGQSSKARDGGISMGWSSGREQTTGNANIFIGRETGRYTTTGTANIAVGYQAGTLNSTGDSNIFLGYQAGYNEIGSNKLYISNSNTTTPLIYGDFSDGYVTINKNGTDKISFYAGSHAYQISDADYAGNFISGGVSNNKGLYLLFEGTNVQQGGSYRNGGVLIGRAWNFATPMPSSGGGVMIGNRITGTVTSGTGWLPEIIIGSGVDLGSTTNNAGGIIIGASISDNIGGGVVIGGSGGNFNGVAIKASGHAANQGGTAILGQARGYNVAIGTSSGVAGLNGTASQATLIGNAAGQNSSASVAIGGYAARSATGSYVTAVGLNAFGDAVATGNANTAVGQSAGQKTTGANNTFIGARAAISNTTGNSNTAIGGGLGSGTSPALAVNTTGSRNISIGVNSLETATAASDNIALGHDSGKRAGGSGNIFLGYRTAYVGTDDNASIFDNVVAGHEAGYSLESSRNVFLGKSAGRNNTTGFRNVLVGNSAGFNLGGGDRNVIIGSDSGTNLAGNDSVVIGSSAASTSTGALGVVIGRSAAANSTLNSTDAVSIGYFSNVHGARCTIVGSYATNVVGTSHGTSMGWGATSGSFSVAIGASANAGQSGNIIVGKEATDNGNDRMICIGLSAGKNATGSDNVIIGDSDRGKFGYSNIAIGYGAGGFKTSASDIGTYQPTKNVLIGRSVNQYGLGQVTSNVLIGDQVARNNSGPLEYNVVIGQEAGRPTSGSEYSGIVALGYQAGNDLTSATNSVLIGKQAGSNITTGTGNVMIGEGAGTSVVTGSGNVMIGTRAGDGETGSNKLYVSSGQGSDLIYGEFDNNLCRVNGNFQRVVFGSTETTTSGTIHIRDNTDWATQADATDNTASTGLLGIALGSAANEGLVLFGDVDYTIIGDVGTPVYLDTTAGGFTTTAPTGSGNIVRVMGYIIGSNKIFFNPSNDWLEIV